MIFQSFLVKYGEIGIKGKNRHLFEDALVRQIKFALKDVDGMFTVRKEQGRIFVEFHSEFDYEEVVEQLTKVFGVVGICPIVQREKKDVETLITDIYDYIDAVHPNEKKTFKMNVRRADKRFPMASMELNALIGGKILDRYPNLTVDVHNPDIMLTVEIRDEVSIYSTVIPGPGGMPIGTAGKAMLLLSGGIDSPVAGYMIAKRGVTIEATYFHAPPYTSERAKQKVVDLAKIISKYTGPIHLNIVNFTEIQMYIHAQCPDDELTIIMRRYMMRIAEHFAKEAGCLGLITGESIGQVASQTMQSLMATNAVCTLPVYRPLISFDKNDIISISEKIGTYETSILPFEDCCTIFVAKHPVTKPRVDVIERSERKLAEQIEEMVQKAIETTEVIVCE